MKFVILEPNKCRKYTYKIHFSNIMRQNVLPKTKHGMGCN